MKLQDVIRHNKRWFAKGNQRFFQDMNYRLQLGASGKAYLVRGTAGWSDMFDGVKKWHFRINPVSEEYRILSLVGEIFKDSNEVDAWLAEN